MDIGNFVSRLDNAALKDFVRALFSRPKKNQHFIPEAFLSLDIELFFSVEHASSDAGPSINKDILAYVD